MTDPETGTERGPGSADPPAPVSEPATWWAEHAWVDGTVEHGVALDVARGRLAAVRTGVEAPEPGAEVLRGLTVPGLANAHSHAFHRALRGTVQRGVRSAPQSGHGAAGARAPDSFWAWREVMYTVAERLTPDSYFALARAVYAEMALAGITCVGEFHYLHHDRAGLRYADPNAMGRALIAAAAEAGIRITLLDTCYLSAGFGRPPEGHQRRFSDGSAEVWAERVGALRTGAGAEEVARVGAAVHSVRAVPADALGTVAAWAGEAGAPLHVHLSEQPAENEACLAAHGCTPAELLAAHGVTGPRTTAVHATHLTGADIALLGGSGTGVCMCPTTERDLADGIGPAPALERAGCALSLGSDSHAVVDLLEEARAMELDERLRTRRRGHWPAGRLLRAATADGHAALGWPEAGRLAAGALADFTTIALDSVRTAGPAARDAAEAAVFAATAADVRHTVVGGRHVVRDGVHTALPRTGAVLAEAIAAVRE
ncbi:formimidoylglutamate deiminase [Streptomyces sp. JJ36]|uniref:formimidoylglutamate deiminase n=1 Tax=Streptomyces sp. JJ36 TaxID=2736645 RepID=UPI0027E3D189|nr:formimidoylglutamate deiminase [Streptomyces sp. JJ36]MCF6524045.1 formimidoylglutamate deiminase [Streptomyces sp. JJ36]